MDTEFKYIIAALIVMLGGWIGLSYMEAKTYTKLTGKEVSTFDAMFIQLRVQEPIINE